jgi:4-hydroxyphenylpyruvate dioxygenase-like putative hemolysin
MPYAKRESSGIVASERMGPKGRPASEHREERDPGSQEAGTFYVADTQQTFDRAVAAGARAVTHPTELAFGERVARVRDPQGHLWWIHQRIEELAVDELAQRFANPSAQQAMAYVQQSLASEMKRPP